MCVCWRVGGREAEAAGEWGVVGEEEEEAKEAAGGGGVVKGDSGSYTRKARASIICSALRRRLLQMSDYGSASHSARDLKDKTQLLSAHRPTD